MLDNIVVGAVVVWALGMLSMVLIDGVQYGF